VDILTVVVSWTTVRRDSSWCVFRGTVRIYATKSKVGIEVKKLSTSKVEGTVWAFSYGG